MSNTALGKSRRILLLTYYFPPDLSAGSFRAQALAEALVALDSDLQVDVMTTEPNRYRNHKPCGDSVRQVGYEVTRLSLPSKRFGLSGQIQSFLMFAYGANRQLTGKRYDMVIATSSRLMTACLGAWAAKRTGARLYLDIRDIFAETLEDVFPGFFLWPARKFVSFIERWPIKSAHAINLVSGGFLSYFNKRYRRSDFTVFTNGIDEEFVEKSQALPDQLPHERSGSLPQILYAGNIGDGQGLEKIIPALAVALSGEARITIVGDGGARQRLSVACEGCSETITILDPVPRDELMKLYESADVLFLHLNDYPAFERVLPSKLFEYAAMGKPILAGVGGFAREFIEREVKGGETFSPCNAKEAEVAFKKLSLKITDRSDFVERYRRREIMAGMAEDVVRALRESSDG